MESDSTTEATAAGTALINAIKLGNMDDIKRLVGETPAVIDARNDDGVSAVLTALYRGQREIAEYLANRGAQLDIFDAAALGNLETLADYLDRDRSLVSAWSADGFLAIHLAVFFGQPDALEFLLFNGSPADEQARHPFGVRPLHSAVANKDPEKAQVMAGYLIDVGADVNATQGGGEHGFTPLMAAAQHGDEVLAQMLLDAGADKSIMTADGKTALVFAEEKGHSGVAALLGGGS